MVCGITRIGEQCTDCGRGIMAHSLCPYSGVPATPLTPAEQVAQDGIAAARANVQGLLGALLAGRWPSGDQVGSVERITLRRFDGEVMPCPVCAGHGQAESGDLCASCQGTGIAGAPAPVETVAFKVVNGTVIEEREG